MRWKTNKDTIIYEKFENNGLRIYTPLNVKKNKIFGESVIINNLGTVLELGLGIKNKTLFVKSEDLQYAYL